MTTNMLRIPALFGALSLCAAIPAQAVTWQAKTENGWKILVGSVGTRVVPPATLLTSPTVLDLTGNNGPTNSHAEYTQVTTPESLIWKYGSLVRGNASPIAELATVGTNDIDIALSSASKLRISIRIDYCGSVVNAGTSSLGVAIDQNGPIGKFDYTVPAGTTTCAGTMTQVFSADLDVQPLHIRMRSALRGGNRSATLVDHASMSATITVTPNPDWPCGGTILTPRCGGYLTLGSLWASPGVTNFALLDSQPTLPAWLVFGVQQAQIPLPLPFCNFEVQPILVLPMNRTASGRAELQFRPPTNIAFQFLAQALSYDGTNGTRTELFRVRCN